MSAVSPGPKKACSGAVWPPLLRTLLQAAHQVDWRSSDHQQPCEMQNLPSLSMLPLLLDMLQHILCSFCCSPLGLLFVHKIKSLNADSSPHILDFNTVNHKDLTLPTHSKGVHCFLFLIFSLSCMSIHYNHIGMSLYV